MYIGAIHTVLDMAWHTLLTQVLNLARQDGSLADGYSEGLRLAVQDRQMIGSHSAAIGSIHI